MPQVGDAVILCTGLIYHPAIVTALPYYSELYTCATGKFQGEFVDLEDILPYKGNESKLDEYTPRYYAESKKETK